MSNILLTGSSGFLGKSIINILSKDNSIDCLSRTKGNYIVALENQVPEFKQKYDLVIHAAGKAHSVPKTEIENKQFYDVNVNGTQNLLKGLENNGLPKQFVFISSVSVYGQEFGENINEEHQLDASDAYGLSKIEAERIIRDWCSQHDIICTILRLPLLVGENPPGNLGAMVKAIDKGYFFNIGGGKARKCMVLAQDVARYIPIVAKIGGVYNLTDGYHPNFKELSSAIARMRNRKTPFNMPMFVAKTIGYVGDVLGNKAPINSLKLKKMTSNLTFDDTKARSMFNWNPKSVLEYLKDCNI